MRKAANGVAIDGLLACDLPSFTSQKTANWMAIGNFLTVNKLQQNIKFAFTSSAKYGKMQ